MTVAVKTNANLNLQRQLFARSERVKGIDFHPTEPWVSGQMVRVEEQLLTEMCL